MMKPKDTSILEAIRLGKDEKAIGLLYDESFRKIRDFVRKNSGNLEDAEDMFQDAILVLFKHVQTGKYDNKHDLDGFLYTVARNLWINKIKRDSKKSILKNDYDVSSGEQFYTQVLDNERSNQIMNTFSQIGEKCKEILTMVVYFDFSMKEVCEKLGYPNENAAKTQHYKCKQKLIELVGQNGAFKQLLKDAN
jgi:RNA polymerase sigma factor (sigma-70 family)